LHLRVRTINANGGGTCTVPIPGYIASNSPGRGWSPPEPPMANDSYRILCTRWELKSEARREAGFVM